MNPQLISIEEKPLNGEDIAREAMNTLPQRRIDELSSHMKQLPQVSCPLTHEFTPGLYRRTIFMPRGTFIISKIHKTEHPFVITKGKVSVWIEGVGVKTLEAGHIGKTVVGTRRLLYIHEDCIWTTFHPTNKTDIAEIERDCVYDAENDSGLVDSKIIAQLERGDV